MAVEPPYVAAVTEVFASNPASTFVSAICFSSLFFVYLLVDRY